MRARDPHIFSILGDAAAIHFNPVVLLEQESDLLISERRSGVFGFDVLLDLSLDDEERSICTPRAVDRF